MNINKISKSGFVNRIIAMSMLGLSSLSIVGYCRAETILSGANVTINKNDSGAKFAPLGSTYVLSDFKIGDKISLAFDVKFGSEDNLVFSGPELNFQFGFAFKDSSSAKNSTSVAFISQTLWNNNSNYQGKPDPSNSYFRYRAANESGDNLGPDASTTIIPGTGAWSPAPPYVQSNTLYHYEFDIARFDANIFTLTYTRTDGLTPPYSYSINNALADTKDWSINEIALRAYSSNYNGPLITITNLQVNLIPEPSVWLLLGIGLLVLTITQRLRRAA